MRAGFAVMHGGVGVAFDGESKVVGCGVVRVVRVICIWETDAARWHDLGESIQIIIAVGIGAVLGLAFDDVGDIVVGEFGVMDEF